MAKNCEDCRFWRCVGYHCYECTNPDSEYFGESRRRDEGCCRAEED